MGQSNRFHLLLSKSNEPKLKSVGLGGSVFQVFGQKPVGKEEQNKKSNTFY